MKKTLVTFGLMAMVTAAACKKEAPPAPRAPAEVVAPASGGLAHGKLRARRATCGSMTSAASSAPAGG